MAWVQSCMPAASAFIMRSRISDSGCISLAQQAVIVRLVGERLEEISGAASRANRQHTPFTAPIRRYGIAERVAHAHLGLVFNVRNRAARIDARGQFAAFAAIPTYTAISA